MSEITTWSDWLEKIQNFAADTCPKTKVTTMTENEEELAIYNRKQAKALRRTIHKIEYIRSVVKELCDHLDEFSEYDEEFEFNSWLTVSDYTFLRMIHFEHEALAEVEKEISEYECQSTKDED